MQERRTKIEQYPDIMTTADLKEFLGVSKETVLKMVHTEGFPRIVISGGRKYLFPKTAVQEYLHNTAIGA